MKLINDCSKLNSSVYGETPHKNIPTQNPIHIGHLNSSPSFPFIGLTGFNIVLEIPVTKLVTWTFKEEVEEVIKEEDQEKPE